MIAQAPSWSPDCQSPKPDTKEIPLCQGFAGVSKGSWRTTENWPCFHVCIDFSTFYRAGLHCRARATSSAVWIQVINRSCHSRSFRPLKRHGAGNSLVNWRRLKSRHDRLNSPCCAHVCSWTAASTTDWLPLMMATRMCKWWWWRNDYVVLLLVLLSLHNYHHGHDQHYIVSCYSFYVFLFVKICCFTY